MEHEVFDDHTNTNHVLKVRTVSVFCWKSIVDELFDK